MNHLNIVDMDNAIEELRKERDEAIVKCERLSELNNKLTEDFNTLALDRSQWQECAKKAEAVIKAAQPAVTDDEPLSARDLAMIDQAWENHKTALQVATVINDNQPGRTAIIEITIDPPTLPVGTKLYAGPKMVELAAETSPGDVVAMIYDRLAVLKNAGAKRLPIGAIVGLIEYCEQEAAIDRLDVKAEAKSQEPVAVAVKPKWEPLVKTVADLVNNLLTVDQTMEVHAAYFINYNDGRKEARTRSPSISRERVANSRINMGDETVPYSLVIWTSQDERAHPTTKPEAPAVSVDAIKDLVRSFHRNSCYPEAGTGELNAVVDAIAALIAGER